MRSFFFFSKYISFFFFVEIDLWLLIVINADTRARRVSEIKADNNTHTQKKKEINDQVSGARKKKGNTKYCRVYYFITLFIFGRCVEEMMTGT